MPTQPIMREDIKMGDIGPHEFMPGVFFSSPGSDPSTGFSTPLHTPPDFGHSDAYTHVNGAHPSAPRTLGPPFVYHGMHSRGPFSISPPVAAPVVPFVPSRPAAVPISPCYTPQKQKPKRTPTACEECRKRKQKCDGENPCQPCKDAKLDCQYRDMPPNKKDTTVEKILEFMSNISEKFTAWERRLKQREETQDNLNKKLIELSEHLDRQMELQSSILSRLEQQINLLEERTSRCCCSGVHH